MGLLIAGAKERGELEERVTSIIKEIKKSGECPILSFVVQMSTFYTMALI